MDTRVPTQAEAPKGGVWRPRHAAPRRPPAAHARPLRRVAARARRGARRAHKHRRVNGEGGAPQCGGAAGPPTTLTAAQPPWPNPHAVRPVAFASCARRAPVAFFALVPVMPRHRYAREWRCGAPPTAERLAAKACGRRILAMASPADEPTARTSGVRGRGAQGPLSRRLRNYIRPPQASTVIRNTVGVRFYSLRRP